MRLSVFSGHLAHTLRTASLAAALCAFTGSTPALGQYDDPGAYDEGVPQPEAGVSVPDGDPGLPGAEPDFSKAPSTYTVKPGDTLWDITSRTLGNPWYWPKVWSQNGQIENPNWIEPGTTISFFGGEQMPTEVETEDEMPSELEPALAEVTMSGKIFQASASMRLLDEGFVTLGELDSAGTLRGSFEEKSMLSTFDQAYVSFPQEVSVGARYVIFRTDRKIVNPVTNKPAGYLTRLLGVGRIISTNKGGYPTLLIEGVQDSIERDDRLMPWSESLGKTIIERPNQVELEGMILAAFAPRQVTIGESHFVFIDKGRKHGVEVGNTFDILQKGDPLDIDHRMDDAGKLPWELVGRVMVVEARDDVSTAVVVKSVRELGIADRAVMHVGGAR